MPSSRTAVGRVCCVARLVDLKHRSCGSLPVGGPWEQEVRLGEGALESFTAVSLDAVPGRSEHSYPLTDTLGGTEPGFDVIVNREPLRSLLRALPERQRQILYMRFFCEMTQDRIARQLGLSQMHVSRLNHPHLCAPARPGDGRGPRSHRAGVGPRPTPS
ncbi:sigma factor-like helix-turn-helix DNA-binding protein [Streptomyces sp. NPDC002851]